MHNQYTQVLLSYLLFHLRSSCLVEIFAVNVDNPISYYTRDSHNCILQYAIPVFCIDRNSQLLGFFH